MISVRCVFCWDGVMEGVCIDVDYMLGGGIWYRRRYGLLWIFVFCLDQYFYFFFGEIFSFFLGNYFYFNLSLS